MFLSFALFCLPTEIHGFPFGVSSEDTTDAAATAIETSGAAPETTELYNFMIMILCLLLVKENKHKEKEIR